MTDEKLNLVSHDMEYINHDETTVSGSAQVLQHIKIRLLMVKGEFFGDSRLGNIDFKALSLKQNIPAMVDAWNKATIKGTPEVVAINSYSSIFDTQKRTLEIKFSVQTVYGKVTSEVAVQI
jgi:hypothetical protein